MVRQAGSYGLSGSHDVSASSADPRVDRERYRAPAERSFHLAKPI